MTLIDVDPREAQREAARERANTIRLWRADQKREMTARKAMALISERAWITDTWRVGDLLQSVPKLGPMKVGRMLMEVGAYDATPLRDLSVRQRIELVQWLEKWA